MPPSLNWNRLPPLWVATFALLLTACAPTVAPAAPTPAPAARSATAPPTTAPAVIATSAPAASSTNAPRAAAGAPRVYQPADKATINWKQFAGTTLNVMMVPHPYTEAFTSALPEFEALTGIKVNVTALPYGQAVDKIRADLSSGQSQFDVVFSAYPLDWQFGQFYAPLDDFLNDPSLTDKEWYDFNDFMPLVIESGRWDGVAGHALGNGPLLSMPVMVETYILSYRKDLFEKYGVKVPDTWDEFFDAAKKLTRTDDGRQTYGLVARGTKTSGPLFTNILLMYKANGASDFNDKLQSTINDPRGVEVTDKYLKTLKEASPPGWPNVSWDDALHRFAAGDYAMIHDIDFGAQVYENPAVSNVAGKVAYALPPAGPQGRFSNIWSWGLAISKSSKSTKASWLLTEWATSQQVLRSATLAQRNFDPSRQSVWNDPKVVDVVKNWGGGTYRTVVNDVLANYAKLRWTPVPQNFQIGEVWMENLHKAYAGQVTTKDALNTAAAQIDALMQRSGPQRP